MKAGEPFEIVLRGDDGPDAIPVEAVEVLVAVLQTAGLVGSAAFVERMQRRILWLERR